MIKIHNLTPPKASRHRKKIVGRGRAAGHGATAGRGMKGQLSRRGEGKKPGFEGGQTPLIRRIPKFGFTHIKKIKIKAFNIYQLLKIAEKYNLSEITTQTLQELGYIKKNEKLKLLACAKDEDFKNTNLKKIKTDFASKKSIEILKGKGIELECLS
ncbi:MAG: 50S ribosomal protein L15 [bacterium]|nr:50S ribosomal protein L15 [bacterium]